MARVPQARESGGGLAAWVRANPVGAVFLIAVVALLVLVIVVGSEFLVPLIVLAVVLLTVASVSAERSRRGTHARAGTAARVETHAPDADPGGTAPERALTSDPPER
jgi:hypothetical protein